MNSNIFNRLSIWKDDEKIAFRKKALIFLFFLVISVILWLMNVLNNDYTAEIDYPVRYINFPGQKIQVGDPPDKLRLKVNAQGYSLLKSQLGSRYQPVSINLNAFTIYRMTGPDSSRFFLQTEYLSDYIRNQLSDDIEIISIKPDTIEFVFADIRSKSVPVKPLFTYRLGKQMILKRLPLLEPDSIMVSGPDFVIDTLSGLETVHIDLGVISRSRVVNVRMNPGKYIFLKKDNIRVSFDVEQFTEKTIQVPVSVINLPEHLVLRTFPPNVELKCKVGLSNYEKLLPASFKAQVDYNEIRQSGTGKLKVEIVKQPDFITSVYFLPKTVEYLIEK